MFFLQSKKGFILSLRFLPLGILFFNSVVCKAQVYDNVLIIPDHAKLKVKYGESQILPCYDQFYNEEFNRKRIFKVKQLTIRDEDTTLTEVMNFHNGYIVSDTLYEQTGKYKIQYVYRYSYAYRNVYLTGYQDGYLRYSQIFTYNNSNKIIRSSKIFTPYYSVIYKCYYDSLKRLIKTTAVDSLIDAHNIKTALVIEKFSYKAINDQFTNFDCQFFNQDDSCNNYNNILAMIRANKEAYDEVGRMSIRFYADDTLTAYDVKFDPYTSIPSVYYSMQDKRFHDIRTINIKKNNSNIEISEYASNFYKGEIGFKMYSIYKREDASSYQKHFVLSNNNSQEISKILFSNFGNKYNSLNINNCYSVLVYYKN